MATDFAITPHKVSICVLLQTYALPSSQSPAALPFPFSSVFHHNRLGLLLLALVKSYDDVLEPKLEQLLNQLREVSGPFTDWLIDHLTSRLSALSCADDLFNFFAEARGVLAGSDSVPEEDNQVVLDPNSCLGTFLRRCILSFNLLSFEGVCHLLTIIGVYCKDALSNCSPYELVRGDLNTHSELLSGYESMELENLVLGQVTGEFEVKKRPSERISFHLHVPGALGAFIEETKSADVQVHSVKRSKCMKEGPESYDHLSPPETSSGDANSYRESFLRTNLQVQGYLMEQVGALEKHGGTLSLNAFEVMLKRIKKLAPELHRVYFLQHLNSLYHDDFFSALHDLHCYFDRSAGTEGLDLSPPCSGSSTLERFETALLCLGMMHLYLGHPKQALEVLAEGVRFSQQQSNDSCLAYTLAVICNLLSETGGSSINGILGTSYSPLINAGSSFSVEQQLYILLTESLRRAENLKLQRLVASNHLAMAKFHLMHVQRPLLSFGPKASMKTKTCPINVGKELRLCCHLISEFSSEDSNMTIDGVFSTAWLNNLSKPLGSVFLSQENGQESNPNFLQVFASPSSIPKSVLQTVGSSYLLRATVWDTYGSAPLARMSCLTYATCFADTSSASDAALVHAKLIQYLAVFRGYKEAFSALKVAEEKFLSASRSVILLVKLQLLHEYALHRGNLKLAQRVCDELGVLASPASGVDMKLKTEAGLRHARTLLAVNQFSQAAAVAHSLFCMCYKFNMQVENATVLLLLAEIHKKSDNAVMALPYALACLSFCQSLNLDLLKASATITLAELLLSLGPKHAIRALILVHEALPMVLGHGGLELCARAHMAEAKCRLADPNFSVHEDSEAVLDPLRQASDELQVLEYHEMAAEAFYLMAITFDKVGQLKEREEAADSFRKHLRALENPINLDDPFYNML